MKSHRFALLILIAAVAAPLGAQSLLYRTSNLGGTWTPDPGVLQFNFLHRFYVAPSSGSNKVTNFPTFTFAVGVGRRFALGTHYTTNSLLVTTPYRPNEFELFGRARLMGAEGANGLGIAVTPAYNTAARSFDGEVAADYTRGAVTVSAAVRGLAKPFGRSGGGKIALAGGFTARLNSYVGVGADYAKLTDPDTTAAWSATVDFLIPGSPHTFSLHASKAASNTLQGASVGFAKVLYGFEFTIPLHFARFAPWFHSRRRVAATGDTGPVAATVKMRGYAFQTDSITITTGQAVRWTNDDPVEHTVTFDEGGVDSGIMTLDQIFVHRFEHPGVYHYHCTPHSYMKGVVVVK